MQVLVAPSRAALPFSETFPHDGSLWRPWYWSSGTPTVASGKVANSGGVGTATIFFRNLLTTPSAVAVLMGGSAGVGYAHVFCGTDSLNGVTAFLSQYAVKIWTRTAGVFTEQVLIDNFPTAITPGVLEISKSGSTYTAKVAGVTWLTWTGTASWGSTVGVILGDSSTFTADSVTAS